MIPLGTNVDALIAELKSTTNEYPEAELNIEGVDLPEISPPDGEFAKILCDTVIKLGKSKPVLTPDVAISDCRYWRYLGIPAYWYGPGGELCSAADEYVTIEDLIHTVKVHTLAAISYLSN